MEIIKVNRDYFGNNLNSFVDIVYNHFIDLSNDEKLKHTKDDIKKLIESENFRGYIVRYNGKYIIGYILGEITHLNDGRDVYFISYLYTVKNFRNHGIASKLIDWAKNNMKKEFVYTMMLICDTGNKKLVDFYMKKGYMLDMILRRYEKHDVFSSVII